MATRTLERSKRRMPCRVHAEGRQHNGIVLDLSGSGLFIQTSAKLMPGVHVQIDLSLPGGDAPMTVEVVRRKQVPAQLLTVAHGGIGVRILSAPEAYYRFLQEVQEREKQQAAREQASSVSGATSVPTSTAPSGPRFRVRVSQTSGIRSRTLVVAAASAEAASHSTQRELGDEWKVVAVEPV